MVKENGPAPRRTRRSGGRGGGSSDRHDEIVQLAGELFAERGFLATTIRDIADAANVLSGSLYHHFESKESIADELLRAYWDELLGLYEAAAKEDLEPAEKVRRFVGASILMLERHRYAVCMLLSDWGYLSSAMPYLQENLERIREIWIDLIKRGIREGAFAADLDPDVVYLTIMGSISGAGRWYKPGGRLTTTELATQMSDLFLSGILAPDKKVSSV